MIFLRVERLEDFIYLLNRRVGDEVYIEIDSGNSEFSKKQKICLSFFGKIDQLMVLHQIIIETKKPAEEIKKGLKETFSKYRVRLIEGRIREIMLSL
ncbi:MAG: hypothetical protein Q6352_013040 [Candidatus Freyrarchaeum guaymaensis]